MTTPQPIRAITSMADAVVVAGLILDNQFRPFIAAGGPYENLSGQVKPGVNTFQTGWYPIDPVTAKAVVDDAPANSVTMVDADHGLIQPDPQPQRSLLVLYNYKRLSDSEVYQVCVVALSHLEFFTDPGQMDRGLYAAFFHYIRGEGYSMVSIKYAEQVSVSLRGRTEQRQQMSLEFKAMAELHFKLGDNAREAFYKRAGAREAPSRGRSVISLVPWDVIR